MITMIMIRPEAVEIKYQDNKNNTISMSVTGNEGQVFFSCRQVDLCILHKTATYSNYSELYRFISTNRPTELISWIIKLSFVYHFRFRAFRYFESIHGCIRG